MAYFRRHQLGPMAVNVPAIGQIDHSKTVTKSVDTTHPYIDNPDGTKTVRNVSECNCCGGSVDRITFLILT